MNPSATVVEVVRCHQCPTPMPLSHLAMSRHTVHTGRILVCPHLQEAVRTPLRQKAASKQL